MNIFSDLKAKRRENRKKEIESQARQRIGVKDFDGELFFAVDGTPLLPVEENATPKSMLATLGTLRDNLLSQNSRSLAHAEWRCIRILFCTFVSFGVSSFRRWHPFSLKTATFTGSGHKQIKLLSTNNKLITIKN